MFLRSNFTGALLSLTFLSLAAAEDFKGPRSWNYRGKTLEGVSLVSWSADGSKVSLKNGEGRVVELLLKDFSKEDQAFVAKAIESAASVPETPVLETDPIFRQFSAVDRTSIPILDQGEYGQKASDCVPSSFCNFLLWWDQQNVLPIPKRGDFDAKAEWIHTQIARLCRTRNNAGTYYEDAMEGFGKYFEKETPELMTHHMKMDYDISPANIARYTTGYNATMLCMTTERGTDKSGHMVALVSATADGSVVFNTWGHRMKGKITVLKASDKVVNLSNNKEVTATTYEIKLDPDPKFEDWINQTRFILDPADYDAILIVKPYVFAEAGKKSKAPADPLMKH